MELLKEQGEEFNNIKQAFDQCRNFIFLESDILFHDKIYTIQNPSAKNNSLDYEKSSEKRRVFLERYKELLSELVEYPDVPDNVVGATEIREVHRRRVEHHQKIVSSLEKLLEECAVSVTTAEKSTKTVKTPLNNN